MILLDTNAVIDLARAQPIKAAARTAVGEAARLFVSAASVWEIGLLATRTGRTGPVIGDARAWIALAKGRIGFETLPLDEAVALEAAYLPGVFHRDPSDRAIVATARLEGLAIVTSDRRILAYADAGHVRAVAS